MMRQHLSIRFFQSLSAGILVTASLALSSVAYPPATLPVYASGTCVNDVNNGFDEWIDKGDGGYGTTSWIVTRVPSFCTGDNPLGSVDHIDAWAMEAANTSDPNGNYAQAGYTISPGESSPQIFAEYTSASCVGACTRYEAGGAPTGDGDNFQYIVSYVPTQHAIYMDRSTTGTVAGTMYIANTDYDPTDSNANGGENHWPGPWEMEWAGENQNPQDDVPGTASKKASFTSIRYSPAQTNILPPDNLKPITQHTIRQDQPYWCQQQVGADAFNIWTAGAC